MSTLTTAAASVSFSPFAIVADMELPQTSSIYARVVAVQSYYHRMTGRHLDAIEAVRLLDRLIAERDDTPFPARFRAVVEHLRARDHAVEEMHEIVAYLARHGTTLGCPFLPRSERAAVEALLPGRAGR